MRFPHLVHLSVIFGFFTFESAAYYTCPSGILIQNDTVRSRAQEIMNLGVQLDVHRTPGQVEMSNITFYGSKAGGDLWFTSDFNPPITTENTFKISISYPGEEIVLTEFQKFGSGSQEGTCDVSVEM
ncbi:CSEP0111 putative effector protein [Blumeria hordei DH14]|uniref:CSEP0111 putative effector protein n=1 Tax=Blumeria graminis f. sp. hordei (strain DH14) TaxID=546991 RepID=N1J8G1_BLUG1|nr:CSEP0111 putative effector protein [Blumeria hordei DH14]